MTTSNKEKLGRTTVQKKPTIREAEEQKQKLIARRNEERSTLKDLYLEYSRLVGIERQLERDPHNPSRNEIAAEIAALNLEIGPKDKAFQNLEREIEKLEQFISSKSKDQRDSSVNPRPST